MSDWSTDGAKTGKLKMDRGWQWLLYIDILLPLVLFLLGLVPVAGIGRIFSQFFVTYNLYILKTIPDFMAWTGILGLLIHLWMMVWAAVRRRWWDLLICAIFAAAVTLYFVFGLNYQLAGMLEFGI